MKTLLASSLTLLCIFVSVGNSVWAATTKEPSYDIDMKYANNLVTNGTASLFAGAAFHADAAGNNILHVGDSMDEVAGGIGYQITDSIFGYAVEDSRPDYYLGDVLIPPDNYNWFETYEANKDNANLIFDLADQEIYVAVGGPLEMNWVVNATNGIPNTNSVNLVISPTPSARPVRLYWTDGGDFAPVNLSGKFVKLFGPQNLFTLKYGAVTNHSGGMEFVQTNIISGVYIDSSAHMLYAAGRLEGCFTIAYYDSSEYDNLLHVETVQVLGPTRPDYTNGVRGGST